MRIAVFADGAGAGSGSVEGDEVVVISRGSAGSALRSLIEAGRPGLADLKERIANAPRVPLESVRLGPSVVSNDRQIISTMTLSPGDIVAAWHAKGRVFRLRRFLQSVNPRRRHSERSERCPTRSSDWALSSLREPQ